VRCSTLERQVAQFVDDQQPWLGVRGQFVSQVSLGFGLPECRQQSRGGRESDWEAVSSLKSTKCRIFIV
jgi:hypothetical protein